MLLFCQLIILQMLGIKILDGLTENEWKHILNPRIVLCLELMNNVLTVFHFNTVVDDLVRLLFLPKENTN